MAEPQTSTDSGTDLGAHDGAERRTARSAPRIRAFVASLHELKRRDDRAALAALRRGLGKEPGTVIAMFPYVGAYLGDDFDGHNRRIARQNDAMFIAAALFGLHPLSKDAAADDDSAETDTSSGERSGESSAAGEATVAGESAPTRNVYRTRLTHALRSLRTGDSERDQAIDRRVVALLNSDIEGLSTMLRQMISLLDDDEGPIDWSQLISDIAGWDEPDRRVQKAWARAWWTAPTREEIASVGGKAGVSDSAT